MIINAMLWALLVFANLYLEASVSLRLPVGKQNRLLWAVQPNLERQGNIALGGIALVLVMALTHEPNWALALRLYADLASSAWAGSAAYRLAVWRGWLPLEHHINFKRYFEVFLLGFTTTNTPYDLCERLWPRNHLKKLILLYAIIGLQALTLVASVLIGSGFPERFGHFEAYALVVGSRAYLHFWLTRGALPRLDAYLQRHNLYNLHLNEELL